MLMKHRLKYKGMNIFFVLIFKCNIRKSIYWKAWNGYCIKRSVIIKNIYQFSHFQILENQFQTNEVQASLLTLQTVMLLDLGVVLGSMILESSTRLSGESGYSWTIPINKFCNYVVNHKSVSNYIHNTSNFFN